MNTEQVSLAGKDGGAQRLAKRVAALVPCSRAEAERYVLGGWVRVDGQVVDLPEARVRDDQAVVVDAQARPEPLQAMTLVWHQPAGPVAPAEAPLPEAWAQAHFTDAARAATDRSGVRPLRAHLRQLQPLVPLGAGETGLAVFTQNAGVARKLGDAALTLEHEWLVSLGGPVLADAERRAQVLRSLAEPLGFEGRPLPVARASWQNEQRLRLAIKGCLPGQVAFLCERAGLLVAQAQRLRLGRIALAGLPAGQWRYLLAAERF